MQAEDRCSASFLWHYDNTYYTCHAISKKNK